MVSKGMFVRRVSQVDPPFLDRQISTKLVLSCPGEAVHCMLTELPICHSTPLGGCSTVALYTMGNTSDVSSIKLPAQSWALTSTLQLELVTPSTIQ